MTTTQTTTGFRAWFESVEIANECYPLDEVVYRDSAGGLLDVAHDFDALTCVSAAEWKGLFRERGGTTLWPYGSGVWKYKEWVLPNVEDRHIVSLLEGNTNLFWAKRLGSQLGLNELWIKLCGNSHTGSFKDLGMTVLVSYVNQLIERGHGIHAIACASTGDTSAAMAAYAAAAGIPAVVILPQDKVSSAQLVQPIANDAIVFSLDTDFDGCMAVVQELVQDSALYLANSMNCLRLEGQKTLSIEVAEQFGWEVPDWIVIPGGNLGNVSALAKGFDQLVDLGLVDRRPRLCVAQAEAANPLYQSFLRDFDSFESVEARRTQASAIRIGNPVSISRAIPALRRFNGVVEQANETELAEAAAEADRTGLFTCPQTGVALAATKKLLRRGVIRRDDRVVLVSTANGLKFSEFKTGQYATGCQLDDPVLGNEPIKMKANSKFVCRRLHEEIERRREKRPDFGPNSHEK